MVPVALWLGKMNETHAVRPKDETLRSESLGSILKNALRDRNYRLLVISFATCGFNMSIIESHLFSQYMSYGIPGRTASLTLTVYGIATMLGAVAVGFLGTRFQMKNVLGCVYAIRIFISLGFLFLPKTTVFAFAATALLGISGDATVPPTSGIISRKFDAEKMAVLYGFTLIGHQIGAFASSNLGGMLVKLGMGYEPLWLINMILAAIAASASFAIRKDIQEEKGYVITYDSQIAGYMCIDFSGEPAYEHIEGKWHTILPYAVIHRMAISKEFRIRGLSSIAFTLIGDLCLSKNIRSIRVDTDFPNKRMKHILEKNGFSKCGIIVFQGSGKLAYDKTLSENMRTLLRWD